MRRACRNQPIMAGGGFATVPERSMKLLHGKGWGTRFFILEQQRQRPCRSTAGPPLAAMPIVHLPASRMLFTRRWPAGAAACSWTTAQRVRSVFVLRRSNTALFGPTTAWRPCCAHAKALLLHEAEPRVARAQRFASTILTKHP